MYTHLRKIATPPYMGVTLWFGGLPNLVIGRHQEQGRTYYELENERGEHSFVVDDLPFDHSYNENNKLVAASRTEGSPLQHGTKIGGVFVGNLAYDLPNDKWHVKVSSSDIVFPLEEIVDLLERRNWDHKVAIDIPSLDNYVPYENRGLPEHLNLTFSNNGQQIQFQSSEVTPGLQGTKTWWGQGSDGRVYLVSSSGVILDHTGRFVAQVAIPKQATTKIYDEDIDHVAALLASIEKETQGGYTIRGDIAAQGGGMAEGTVVRPDIQSKEEIMSILDALPSHADDAKRQQQYFREKHDWGYYDNPYINRGGSNRFFFETMDDDVELAKEAAPNTFVPGPSGIGVTYAPGAILVSRYLTPEDNWLMFNPAIRGMVVEVGGATSHGAVVAREIGVPIVLNCPEAARIMPGDKVQVDGDSGAIHVNGGGAGDERAVGPGRAAAAGVMRYAWSNGVGDFAKIDPENPDKRGTLHTDLIMQLMSVGHFNFDDATIGTIYDDGTVDQAQAVSDQEQLEAWIKSFYPQADRFEVKDYGAYGLGSPSPAMAKAVWKEAKESEKRDDKGDGEALRCPKCKSHTVSLVNLDKNQFHCHSCGKVFTHEVYKTKSGMSVEANKYIKQRGDKWVIIQKGTGKVLSEHDSKEKAEAAFRAMEMHMHGKIANEIDHTAPVREIGVRPFEDELVEAYCPDCEWSGIAPLVHEDHWTGFHCPHCGVGNPLPGIGNPEIRPVHSSEEPPQWFIDELNRQLVASLQVEAFSGECDLCAHSVYDHDNMEGPCNQCSCQRFEPGRQSSMQKGSPYPENSYENAPDHTPKKQKKDWPAEVNAIYNACMREDKGSGSDKSEKESSCAAIAWAQYKKTVKDKGRGNTKPEKESALPTNPMFTCPQCGNSITPQNNVATCPSCGYSTDITKQPQTQVNPYIGSAPHGPGTRVEILHPSAKGQKGSILDQKGKDKATDEELYDVLLDSGEKKEGLRSSDFKKIRSAGYTPDGLKREDYEDEEHFASTVAKFADRNGDELAPGKWYTMYSTQYTVPDLIHVTEVAPNHISVQIEGDDKGLFPLVIDQDEADKMGYSFDPHIKPPELTYTKDLPQDKIDGYDEIRPHGIGASVKEARRRFTTSEQRELIDESLGARARNIDKLDLTGTHYTSHDLTTEASDETFLWLW